MPVEWSFDEPAGLGPEGTVVRCVKDDAGAGAEGTGVEAGVGRATLTLVGDFGMTGRGSCRIGRRETTAGRGELSLVLSTV